MVEDVMELLRLFGVPYLVCPMEAEAQCAALEQLGLVDGIITDDSDIFPFGGKKVYKNIFHNQKFVEAFFAQDIEKELGFSQEEMIALALLLGSDYTDGIRGIGIVNATEVVNAYPGLAGLEDFKKWVQAFDLAEEAQRLKDKKAKKSDSEIAEMTKAATAGRGVQTRIDQFFTNYDDEQALAVRCREPNES
uniref:XPG-I domain-containing protein n=1 Tax=Globisporangium ultimum (strain ATCC 200006 / CBS 805.95 / DAOM BR144) TaxID=431595 RepID=K3WLQ1_GLOUD